MKKWFLTLILLVTVSSAAYADETMDLSTYYPSLLGNYDRLRLVPRAEPACTDALAGTLFVDSNLNNTLRICRGTALGWGYVDGIWSQVGDDIFASDSANLNLAVGIGTTTPSTTVHITGTGDLYIEGASTNLMFEDTNGVDFGIRANNNRLMFLSGNSIPALNVQWSLELNGNFGIGTTGARNKLDVEGGAVVGAGYSGTDTAPADGLLVEGAVGLGTNTPRNELDVEGRAAIGAAYSGNRNAPDDGLLVQGNVGIGEPAPVNKVDIDGAVVIGGVNASGNRAAPANGLDVQGTVDIGSDLIVGGEVTFSDTDSGRVDFDGGGYIVERGNQLIFGHP